MKNRTFGSLAAAGFLASLIVHVAAWAGESPSLRFSPIWLLHVGIFVVFAPAVMLLAEASKRGAIGKLLAAYPKPVIAAAIVVHIYATVAGMASLNAIEGTAEEHAAGYVLTNHGKFVRELSREEFIRSHAVQDRAFSSLWLSFYGLSALFWWFRPREPSA